MQASSQLSSSRSFSSKLLKLGFCDPYLAEPNKDYAVLTEAESGK